MKRPCNPPMIAITSALDLSFGRCPIESVLSKRAKSDIILPSYAPLQCDILIIVLNSTFVDHAVKAIIKTVSEMSLATPHIILDTSQIQYIACLLGNQLPSRTSHVSGDDPLHILKSLQMVRESDCLYWLRQTLRQST